MLRGEGHHDFEAFLSPDGMSLLDAPANGIDVFWPTLSRDGTLYLTDIRRALILSSALKDETYMTTREGRAISIKLVPAAHIEFPKEGIGAVLDRVDGDEEGHPDLPVAPSLDEEAEDLCLPPGELMFPLEGLEVHGLLEPQTQTLLLGQVETAQSEPGEEGVEDLDPRVMMIEGPRDQGQGS